MSVFCWECRNLLPYPEHAVCPFCVAQVQRDLDEARRVARLLRKQVRPWTQTAAIEIAALERKHPWLLEKEA